MYKDRLDAGARLAEELRELVDEGYTVSAVPAGGVPVAYAIAKALGLRLRVVLVTKALLPWNPEVGFAAVDVDGGVTINEEAVRYFRLTKDEVEEQISRAVEKLRRRRESLPSVVLRHPASRSVVLVDDGLASGYTMLHAVRYARRLGYEKVVVAVPTAHESSASLVSREADQLVCPNVRSGVPYAVADAYLTWYDVGDDEVVRYVTELVREGLV